MRTVRPWLSLALLASFPFAVAACGGSSDAGPVVPTPAAGSTNVGSSGGATEAAQSTSAETPALTPTEAPAVPPTGGDRDADGLDDARDMCPDDPEDRDGFEDEDGCPDPDNDRDGVRDVEDRCPNEPESRNGQQDEDGCPD